MIGAVAVLTVGVVAAESPIGVQLVPRDAFPVFDNPKMLPAAEAEPKGVVTDRDMVMGWPAAGRPRPTRSPSRASMSWATTRSTASRSPTVAR